ncbi:uncharacterized protein LOC111084712 [Limulus polyphemus]|uniref:Uncharacterized protein LOC111084712 n=1 Tax=Limulus polyphemus TaxID=6850 RepID=A0ABM1S069_LIMPO|nr:uncharacterized protein LOC111084712 [Limulus polyphemus]
MKYAVIYVWSFSSILFSNFVVFSSPPQNFMTSYFYHLHTINETLSRTFSLSLTSPTMGCMRQCLRMGDNCIGWRCRETPSGCDILTDLPGVQETENLECMFLKPIKCRNDSCLHGGECYNMPIPSVLSAMAYVCRCRCGSCGPHCEQLNFGRHVGRGIVKNNIGGTTSATPEACQEECLKTPACRSVDYTSEESQCFFNGVIHTDSGAQLGEFKQVDYYYPICKC